jgi:F-type H+-transporting ATPase subunit b
MPQISQLAATYASQIFWLLLTFGLVFFTVGLGMLPKVQGNIARRDQSIAGDLAAAQAARDAAEAAEVTWRERDAANRDAALSRIATAKSKATANTEATLAKANAADADRVAKAEAEIAAATTRAVDEIEAVAAEAAQDIALRVAGLTINPAEARAAVKQAMNNG